LKIIETGGAKIPVLGFGTYGIKEVQATVEAAVAMGYRHVDTAQFYDNEAEVGLALAAASVPREAIFVTTKVWPDHYEPGVFERSVDESVTKLGGSPIDLLLLHWPSKDRPLAETIGLLNAVADRGLARHIGVSNFTSKLMAEAVQLSPRPIVMNQVECHPLIDQSAVLAAARQLGIAVTAYSPLAVGRVFKEARLRRIGEAHGKNAGQIALRWLVDQDILAIPGSSNLEHVAANFAIFDFELTDAERREIDALRRPDGRITDPKELAPEWD
jgi:2,5-diketo-D-gluconate reductase B